MSGKLLVSVLHQMTQHKTSAEDIWLHAKKFVREFYHLCKSFAAVKKLFELVTHHQIFNFPKMFMYDSFSQMI